MKALNTEGYVYDDGSFRAFTDVGCYPLFYLTASNDCLCAKCVKEEGQFTDPSAEDTFVVAADVHWEGEPIVCASCNEEIASAYGEVS